jgi:small basic protein (TIGR04137 family)
MSLDRSLKTSGNLSQSRSVLTRTERIDRLIAEKKLDTSKARPTGLAKTRVGKK